MCHEVVFIKEKADRSDIQRCQVFTESKELLVVSIDRSGERGRVMLDVIINFISNKQLFTYAIMVLFLLNCLVQAFVHRDYAWSGYWAASFVITVCATLINQRGAL